MKKTTNNPSLLTYAIRGIAVGTCILVLLIFVSPFVIVRLDDPTAAVPAAVLIITAVSSFFASFAAGNGSSYPKIITGLIPTAFLTVILLLTSVILEGEAMPRDNPFSLILLSVLLLFAVFGSLATCGKKKSRKKGAGR